MVVLITIAIAATAAAVEVRFDCSRQVGDVIGKCMSALFLLAIPTVNLVIFVGV